MSLESFVRALDGFEAVVEAVDDDRWDAPSPCAGWSAADVAGHMIAGLRAISALVSGSEAPDIGGRPRTAAGSNPAASWQEARTEMMAELSPGVLDRPVPLPWGETMPLEQYLSRYPLELVVHTWDLAQAVGLPVALDPELVRQALETAEAYAPVARSAGLIGPAVVVADDADDQTRLLAVFGRSQYQPRIPGE